MWQVTGRFWSGEYLQQQGDIKFCQQLGTSVADMLQLYQTLRETNYILVLHVWVASQVPSIVVNCWKMTCTADGLKIMEQEQCEAHAGGCVLWSLSGGTDDCREFKCSLGSYHTILTKDLNMHHCLPVHWTKNTDLRTKQWHHVDKR